LEGKPPNNAKAVKKVLSPLHY